MFYTKNTSILYFFWQLSLQNWRNGNYWWFLKVVTSFILFYGFSDNWSKGGGMWVSGRCYESTGVRLSCSTHGLDSDEWTFKSLSLSLHSQHRSVSRRIDNLLIEDSKKLIFFGLALFLFMIQYKSIHFFVIHANICTRQSVLKTDVLRRKYDNFFWVIDIHIGQKWLENDVMAEKRKQSESTESLDEGREYYCCQHVMSTSLL